jgi:hypothetical protein
MRFKELHTAKTFKELADILNRTPEKYYSAWEEINDVLKAIVDLDGGVWCEYDLADDPEINPYVWEKVRRVNPDDLSKSMMAYIPLNATKGEVFVIYGDTAVSKNGKDEFGVEVWPMRMIKLRSPVNECDKPVAEDEPVDTDDAAEKKPVAETEPVTEDKFETDDYYDQIHETLYTLSDMIDKRGETYKGLNAMLQFISEETANKEFDDDDLEWLDDLYAVVDQALNNISDVIHERI